MVAEKVTIDTHSYEAEPSLRCGPAMVLLSMYSTRQANNAAQRSLFHRQRQRRVLRGKPSIDLAALLRFFTLSHLSQWHADQQETTPLVKIASECSEKEYLEFYHSLYPIEPDPIFWIHLSVDYPFNLKGILYFPKITKRFDWDQNTIKLFCNRVFVADNCKDLIPDYLMIMRGAIDSPDIPLNVSRSSLQMDRTVRQLGQHISKKVSDRLSALYTTEREKFLTAWPDVELIVKLGILQDEKFYERAKSFLMWKNLTGEWKTVEEYLELHSDAYNKKIFYTVDEQHNSHFLELYRQQGIEVLCAASSVDSPLINFLESKLDDVSFQRIDGAVDNAILDNSREKTLLDADGKTEAVKIAHYIRSQLQNVDVEAKSLSSDTVPGFVMLDEGMRRMRDTLALTQQTAIPGFAPKRTFVVNTNNKLIQAIYNLRQKEPQFAKR